MRRDIRGVFPKTPGVPASQMIQVLQAKGFSCQEIAHEIGVTPEYIQEVVRDGDWGGKSLREELNQMLRKGL